MVTCTLHIVNRVLLQPRYHHLSSEVAKSRDKGSSYYEESKVASNCLTFMTPLSVRSQGGNPLQSGDSVVGIKTVGPLYHLKRRERSER